ncbi:MAG: type I DNA topoisomerase [Mycoplasmatales bacterium]
MQKLVIVESPAKAKTIEKYLGKDFKVLSSVGHIRDLATSGPGGLGVDVDNDFTPDYKVIRGKKKVITELTKEAKKSDFIYLATDPDREGEAISWHLAQSLELDTTLENRVVFNEITKTGVLNGMESIRSINMDLVHSQEARRIIDRILGFKLSKLLQKKIKEKSAGRVQSVALRLICEKEEEIEAFIPVEYFKIITTCNDIEINYINNDKKVPKEEADKIYSLLQGKNKLKVVDLKEVDKRQNPYMPFTTSTFQQTCINKLGYSSKKSMMLAQKLYEGKEIGSGLTGLITYMRTDSTRMSNDFVNKAFTHIVDTYGEDYKGVLRVKKKDSTQDAHEAIRPTDINNTPDSLKDYLSNEELKVYTLIYNRAISSLMAPAIITTNTYMFKHESDVDFKASYSSIKFSGFKELYSDKEEDYKLFSFEVGTSVDVTDFELNQHFTKPPARYTEAKLIKEMEELGIGRPSTYAATMDTIKNRGYANLEEKKFVPTDSGKLVTNKLKEFFNGFINVDYTRELEESLDQVASGTVDEVVLLRTFYDDLMPLMSEAEENMEKIEAELTGNACPDCGSDLVMRKGRYGKFEACSNFPACKYVVPQEVEKIDDCPECDGNIILKKTKRGKEFFACDNFPKCKYAVWKKEDIGKTS